jgi:hypothetical protein
MGLKDNKKVHSLVEFCACKFRISRFALIFCKLFPSYLSNLNFNSKEFFLLLGLFCFVEINLSKVEIGISYLFCFLIGALVYKKNLVDENGSYKSCFLVNNRVYAWSSKKCSLSQKITSRQFCF